MTDIHSDDVTLIDPYRWYSTMQDFIERNCGNIIEEQADGHLNVFVPKNKAGSWEEFLQWHHHLTNGTDLWAFRGQASPKWHLNPSIDRILLGDPEIEKSLSLYGVHQNVRIDEYGTKQVTPDVYEVYETRMMFEYQRRAHQYGNVPFEDDVMSWLAMMQHHGCPTRLLDWSYSPYVAAYFAFEEAKDDPDVAIWAINLTRLEDQANKILEEGGQDKIPYLPKHRAEYLNGLLHVKRKDAPAIDVKVEPKQIDPWMTNQRGLFLCRTTGTASSFSSQLLKTWFVRKNRGLIRARAVCQVSDRARVRDSGRCGTRRIFSW